MIISRKPWERRLEDLAHLLHGCSKNYFDPDLFRRNTNQFLQTARTVTFIIQKNKADIPGFDDWYRKIVLDGWAQDRVMTWARDARNIIEKEGDLEINSTLNVSLIYSYLEEEDITVPCDRGELLGAGIKQLIQFAQKRLPTGIADAAGIRIERSWITAELASFELLNTLVYVYSRLYDCCKSLAFQLGRSLPNSIPDPSELAVLGNLAMHVQLVKLRDLKSYHLNAGRIYAPKDGKLTDEFKDRVKGLKELLEKPHDFQSAVQFYRGMAQATFLQWQNHINTLFLLNEDWSVQSMVTPILVDQTDKYFFWRMIGEWVRIQRPHCLVYSAEAWVRNLTKGLPGLAVSEFPIMGECLQTCLVDRNGNRSVTAWDICRQEDGQPTLGTPRESYDSDKRFFFLVPSIRSMGIQPDFIGRQNSTEA
jgi:hypothetical protein